MQHPQMIAADADFHGAPLLRTTFRLDSGHGDVLDASLRVTAYGLVEPWLNGQRVSLDLLTPGWTSYEWRLRVSEYEVTALLAPTSALVLALGNGWYRGRLGWGGQRNLYGDELAGFAELRIRFTDGHEQRLVTDRSWTATGSDTLANDLYDGQTIDARRDGPEQVSAPDWAGSAVGVHEVPCEESRLVADSSPPVRPTQELAPIASWTSPSGQTLLDYGQNLVGWVRVTIRGPRGTEIVLRHAEVLEHDELGVRPLRTAKATDRYFLTGGDDVFEPRFTFHGFRYLEVTGWPGALNPGALTAVVIGSELERTGSFRCSDPLLNRFHENVIWGMRGNFVSVPTDCPQRDERMGWTGDISAFAPTAAFLYDTRAFLGAWLRDLRAEQRAHDGVVPFVVPDALKHLPSQHGMPDVEPTAIWSDSAVWVPWALWQAYGDRAALAEQYEAMTVHVRRVGTRLSPSGVWDGDFQFGDWLDPDAPPDNPAAVKADPAVVATACAYRSAVITAESAAILGHADDASEFTRRAAELRAAFNSEYVHEGRIRSDCTTVYTLAIVFELLDADDRARAGARLVELVEASDFRISTGFAGTAFITDALTATGHLASAYRLLLQTECPSWLYPVTMGATTVWERWDSILPDGSINPGEMTSFNHYALGAVADWMHRTIGGVVAAQPGYRQVLIHPRPGGGITSADTTIRTDRGALTVRWRIDGSCLVIDATVPRDTPVTVRVDGLEDMPIPAGRTILELALPVESDLSTFTCR